MGARVHLYACAVLNAFARIHPTSGVVVEGQASSMPTALHQMTTVLQHLRDGTLVGSPPASAKSAAEGIKSGPLLWSSDSYHAHATEVLKLLRHLSAVKAAQAFIKGSLAWVTASQQMERARGTPATSPGFFPVGRLLDPWQQRRPSAGLLRPCASQP